MMKRIKDWLFCLGLRKDSGFLSWKGSSLIAVRQKGFSLSTEAAASTALMATARASPERSLCRGAWGARVPGAERRLLETLGLGLGNSTGPSCMGFPLWKRQGQCFWAAPSNASHTNSQLAGQVWGLGTSAPNIFIPCWGSSCFSKYDAAHSGKAMQINYGAGVTWSRGLRQACKTSGKQPIDKLYLPIHCPARLILSLDLGERNGKQLNALLLPIVHTYLSTQPS